MGKSVAQILDSLDRLDHRVRRKYKNVFERLNHDYRVRTPVIDDEAVADLIIEGPRQSWLLIGNHTLPPELNALNAFLLLNEALISRGFLKVSYLAVCKETGSLFSDINYSEFGVSVFQKNEFWEIGDKLIEKYLCAVDDRNHIWLKRNLISESIVNTACTTRRQAFSRDNTAKLEGFFLDYDQELATKYDMWGSTSSESFDDSFSIRLVNGVAGCGKTLILVNRAILYCKKYPNRKVLLLIHNRPVTSDIQYKFKKYLGGTPKNLTIQTFHKYARLQQVKRTPSIKILFSDKDKKPFWDRVFAIGAAAYSSLTISDTQICTEIEYINEFLIKDKAEYLDYERHGRGFALSKLQRENIWALYELASVEMSSPTSGYLPSLYIRNLCLAGEGEVTVDMYDQILIDEAQFFFPSWLELVKKSIKDGGHLFMCADPNQGFLKSRLSWKSVGLNVRGRTKKLSYSYRTTYEIMVAANALISYLNEDTEEFIQPDLQKMTHGLKPQVIYSDTPQDEELRFLNELELAINTHDIPLEQIIVLCSASVSPWRLKDLVEKRLGRNTVVNCNASQESNNLGEKIRVMSINSCTGMEAGVIFVLGVGALLDAENNLDLNEEEKSIAHEESTRKLYVAMTRAGQKLLLFSTEKLPQRVEVHLSVA
jgi:hypothetical protein